MIAGEAAEGGRYRKEVTMRMTLAQWSLILLCFSMACALGGGLYEHIVLTPLWSKSPPSSFAIIQPGTGVPLQRFWIPVHAAITVFILLALFLAWSDVTARRLLLIALASYVVMRAWSGLFFIREMLAFQKIPLDSPPSAELSARVARWTYWTWFREPLDIISFLCSLLALYWFRRP
jgi:hypothetical protein